MKTKLILGIKEFLAVLDSHHAPGVACFLSKRVCDETIFLTGSFDKVTLIEAEKICATVSNDGMPEHKFISVTAMFETACYQYRFETRKTIISFQCPDHITDENIEDHPELDDQFMDNIGENQSSIEGVRECLREITMAAEKHGLRIIEAIQML